MATVIGIDIDGVLASFEHGYAPLLTKVSGIQFPDAGKPDWPREWYWERAAGVTKEQESKVWSQITASKTFWLDLPAHKGTTEFLRWISLRHSDDIYFITHRIGAQAKFQTERWLKRFGFHGSPTVILSGNKGTLCHALNINYYVDDKPENCTDVVTQSPNTHVYMLARTYNHQLESIPRGDLSGFRYLIERS